MGEVAIETRGTTNEDLLVKFRLLELLKDPSTGRGFDVEIFETRIVERNVKFAHSRCRDWCYKNNQHPDFVSPRECERCFNNEIIDGILTVKQSGDKFPIIGGVPRILPKEILQDEMQRKYPDYLAKHRDKFNVQPGMAYSVEQKKKATVDTFGYQWTTFTDNFDYFKYIFLSFTRPFLDEEDFKNKLVLEIGCGSGRPAVTACRLGAEVVGMDISQAVDTAFQKSLEIPFLHVVQADAYAPPFNQAFDIIYSVGVLQHISNPRRALDGMFKVMSQRSPLVLWVYGKRELWYQPVEWLRSVTTRMPLQMLHGLSFLLALWSEAFLLMPYRLLSRVPACNRLADKIPGRIYARFPFKENVVGWFDRLGAPVTHYFNKQEIMEMLSGAGFTDIKIAERREASASWIVEARRNDVKLTSSKAQL